MKPQLGRGSALCCAAVLFMTGVAAAGQPPCDCDAIKLVLAPVCGSDGITYTNRCVAVCQGIEVAQQGACSADSGTAAGGAALTASAGAGAGAAAFLHPSQVVVGAKIGRQVLSKYASEGYSFVGRVKMIKRPKVQPRVEKKDGPSAGVAAAAAGVAPGKLFTTRITPSGDLYIGYTGDAPANQPARMPPQAPLLPRRANGTAAGGRKLLQGNIVGIDSRYQVDKHSYPHTTVGWLPTGCSGALIGPRTVLTAGHCIWNNDQYPGWFYNDYNFWPNLVAGGAYHCHGSSCYSPREVVWEWAATEFVNAQICAGCIKTSDIPLDIAVVRLTEDLTRSNGYLGITYSCSTVTYGVSTCGYPGDKPDFTMWCTGGNMRFNGCAGWGTGSTAYTYLDSYPGQSGSNAWSSDRYVRGVLSSSSNGYTNFRGISKSAYNWIMQNRL